MARKRLSDAPIVDAPNGYKQCTQCGLVLPVQEYSRSSSRSDGLRQRCRRCNAKYRRYDLTKKWKQENMDRVREHNLRYRSKNPFKVAARVLLQSMVRQGKIIRPDVCEKCGRESKVEGHHEDYSKPLEVVWLCKPCHSELSREII